MPTPSSRKTLNNRVFKERKGNDTNTIVLTDVTSYHKLLKNDFNIELPDHETFFPEQSQR